MQFPPKPTERKLAADKILFPGFVKWRTQPPDPIAEYEFQMDNRIWEPTVLLEPVNGDVAGYHAFLEPGFCLRPPRLSHELKAPTVEEFIELRNEIMPCHCPQCVAKKVARKLKNE